MRVEITALVVASRHAYEGRPADGPRPDPEPPLRDEVRVRAGHGIVGDRYAGRPAHARAAVTLLAAESLDHLRTVLGDVVEATATPRAARRNIVLRGAPVDALAAPGRGGTGALFALDSGDGPVRFRAHRAAAPCRWMDTEIGDGAWAALRGRGGVRCEPLDDGVLRLGPAELTILEPAAAAPQGSTQRGSTP
ncbi:MULTISPECIES: molybdenum cofactor biosysynthesis protein [unclassified Pseudonocardia]|uniref:molybdenum cofactor biosysynthesis protein n=1 Tax=unclassified Pseudonocardia TaxID=2619320 RepID=UPI001CF6443E|nr:MULTISPECIES: molybdenum cofactor biosysynthesis protein [unclassified Pseudonocardia]